MAEQLTWLIAQMTLEEKAALCTGATPWRTVAIERLGIPAIVVSDGPHGMRRLVDLERMRSESYPATCFPVAAALSASWNVDLVHEMGQALAEESIALNVDIILGPGINIKRSPLCGRNFEYFSEDPVLAGEMAAALINGIQSKGVGTSLKHFAVNNQETRRFLVDAIVDERTLHEIYLEGFRIAIQKSHPWTIMCAYNSLNGDFCAENAYLLTDILRDRWGFEGFVMSDWGAVHDRVASIKAGLELEMPGSSADRTQKVIDAVQEGELDEAFLDQAVERLLNIIFRAQETPKGNTEIVVEAHHTVARRIAEECIVLLKNDNAILPLRGSEHLAVLGQAATIPVYQGGGSSHINATRVDTPLAFLKERTDVQYAVGDVSVEHNQVAIEEAVSIAQNADVTLLFIALPASIESEGYDRPNLKLTQQQIALIKAVAKTNSRNVVILNNGSAIDMQDWIDEVDAVLEAWLPGQAGAGAIVDIIYGDVNPSGKLGETFPLKLSHTPSYLNFPGENDEVRYGEGIFVGYRGYEALEQEVLFPFGFGLSYTEFKYDNLSISKSDFSMGDSLEVMLDVTNAGSVDGKEIVQLYIHDCEARLQRPKKELKAFAKVSLKAGETKQIRFTLDQQAFSFYDPHYKQWIAEAGEFEILLGSSSKDLHLSQRVRLTQGTSLPHIIHKYSTLGEWMKDARAVELLSPFLKSMFGLGDGTKMGIDALKFFNDTPLINLLRFQVRDLDAPPQQIIDDMLDKLDM